MRPRTLALLALVLAAGCVGFSDEDDASSPTPECTPPPGILLDGTIFVTDAEAYVGNTVGLRLLRGAGIVMSCTSSMAPAETFGITFQAGGPIGDLVAELVFSSDGSIVHGAGDLTRSFALETDGSTFIDAPCSPYVDWTLDFSATDAPSAVTWPIGEGCP